MNTDLKSKVNLRSTSTVESISVIHKQSVFSNETCSSLRVQQSKSNQKSRLLGENQSVYISSIVNTIFQRDLLLLHNDLNYKRQQMRRILLECYLKLNVYQHIYFCAIYYIEKYASLVEIDQKQIIQFVVACLALARKYQKGRPTRLQNWQQKLGFNFTSEQILDFQAKIITTLEFQCQPHTRYTAVCDLFLIVDLDEKLQNFCYFLCDLSVFMAQVTQLKEENSQNDEQFLQQNIIPLFSEGETAIAIVRMTCYFFQREQMDRIDVEKLGYSFQRIYLCCNELFRLLTDEQSKQLKFIRQKYSKSRFFQVSKLQFLNRQDKQRETSDQEQKYVDEEIIHIR